MKRLLLLLMPAILCLGMGQPPQIYSESRPLMHTLWDFSLVARNQAEAHAAIEAAAAEVERLDKALAMWREDSELHAFNAKAGQGPQAVSPDLDRVLSLGQAVSELSGGASDCTVGPLVQLWHAHLEKGTLPSDAEVRAALAHMDYHELKREADGRWSAPAGTIVDLGSLAKGYAQDRAAVVLEARGLHAYLLNAGGQVYARGLKPGGQPWRVGIVHPRHEERMVAILSLHDQALSTSGDYEQSRLVKGRRYHHIIDPRTGRPTTNGTCSVSVLLPLSGTAAPGAGSWCDAMDTAGVVLGQEAGKAFFDRQHAAALLLKEDAPGHLIMDRSALWDPAVDVVLNEP
jgi:thiamine biosynthesis lipoprotein